MNKKLIFSVLRCPDGYMIADDIFSKYGTLIVAKDTIVNEFIRQKLISFNVDRIAVFEPELPKNSNNSPKEAFADTKRKYSEGTNSIKVIIKDLAVGNKLDYENINEISNSFYENMNSNFAVIDCLNQVKSADEYIYTHCVNVSLYSMLIGKWLKLSENEIKILMNAGILHDVGKSKVPAEILNKRGPLTESEFDIIKKHPLYGLEMINDIPDMNDEIKNAVLMHHERENGTGYPYGLKGANISYFAKIISIADAFDAMTSECVYRHRLTPFETFREFEKAGIGGGYYDPDILLTFLHNISQYYIGSKVMMNTGKVGEVVYVPPHCISRPVVRVEDEYIDLSIQKNIKIVEML
ncbi:HD-GYP domain-containing protein [Pseudoclostridium thermosuccinogenes]|uniref:HD-GYP domain-containing protein n=1 Tax=Clostridium thermosuccinogenes TaxID=84032 RepID=UPI002FD919F7